MRAILVIVAFFISSSLRADTGPAKSPAHPGFEKVKSLAGTWKGKTQDGASVTVKYRVVANGSVVEEHLSFEDMITMYHVDGDRLMLTHYCAARNQPRMRAAPFEEGGNTLSFAFFDATNMADPNAMHMHNARLTFIDADRIRSEWTHYEGGRESGLAVMNLERVK